MRTGHARPWRRGSDYAAPPRNQLDRGQRHVWRRRVVAEVRAGNLPGKAILTAEALLACMGETGELYPSHQAIASKAGVGLRTVARHVNAMVTLGLIERHRRLVRVAWPEGGRGAVRVQQASNSYLLIFPANAVMSQPRCKNLSKPYIPKTTNTAGHSGSEESGNRFIYPSALDRSAALAALEEVRVAREVACAEKWWAGRR